MTSKTATLAAAVGGVFLLILRPRPLPLAVEPTLT